MSQNTSENKSTAERLKELNEVNPNNQEGTMLKVMDTYRKGV